MSWVPFSVGEWVLILAVAALIVGVILLILCAVKCESVRKLTKCWWNVTSWVVLWVLLVMTLHCFVLYHASGFAERYIDVDEEATYSEEQLLAVYNILAEKCNRLSGEFARDAQGYILYESNLEAEAKAAMQNLGDTYPLLSGYYPTAKEIYFSEFFSQQYLAGIFLPYTMEANYNRIMYITNKPFTICHELAHIKGFIYEDEANFIAYLACTQSDNQLFQYSAYLEMYGYVLSDIYENYDPTSELWADAVRVNELVADDRMFLTPETWDEVEADAILSTDTVSEVADKVNDTSLKLNGVEDGVASYSRVVELLLAYYSDELAE